MDALREEVARGCRALHLAGLGDLIWGHLSARDPDGRGTWIKAAGSGFDEVTSEDVVLIDRAGTVLVGDGRCPIEYPIHTEILAARPDVGAVVHAHPAHAVAFMATGAPLRPISHDATLFVPPDVPRFTETGALVRTAELGGRLAATLGPHPAAFMHHHGIVCVGRDVPAAVMAAALLERSCRLQLLAAAGGGVATWSSDDEARAKREMCWPESQLHGGWAYLARRAATGPETAP
jgi:L-fuculose-phosphate aldolase